MVSYQRFVEIAKAIRIDGVSARWRSKESGCDWDLELSALVKDLPLAKLGEDHRGHDQNAQDDDTMQPKTQCSGTFVQSGFWGRQVCGFIRSLGKLFRTSRVLISQSLVVSETQRPGRIA